MPRRKRKKLSKQFRDVSRSKKDTQAFETSFIEYLFSDEDKNNVEKKRSRRSRNRNRKRMMLVTKNQFLLRNLR